MAANSPMITMAAPPVHVYPQSQQLCLPAPMIQPAQSVIPMQPGPVYYQNAQHGFRPQNSSVLPGLSRSSMATMGTTQPMVHPANEYYTGAIPRQHIPSHAQQAQYGPNPVFRYPTHGQAQQDAPKGPSWKQRVRGLFAMRTGRASTISDTSSIVSNITPSPHTTRARSRAHSPEMRNPAAAVNVSTPKGSRKTSAASTRPPTPFPKDLPPRTRDGYSAGGDGGGGGDGGDGGVSSESSSGSAHGNRRDQFSRQSNRSWRGQARKSMEHGASSRPSSPSSDGRPQTPQPIGGS
jgi:hypothetical protein